MSNIFNGKCHCGDIRFVYRTGIAPSQWPLRACQCSFCRAHSVRATSDPSGSVQFEVANPDSLVRYEFGLRTAQFLICKRCGVYVAAVTTTPRGRYATINVNSLAPCPDDLPAPQPMKYEQETREDRNTRREQRWTPVTGAV